MVIVDLLTSCLAAAASSPESMLTPMGPVAAEQKAHFLRIIAITMIAIVPVLIGTPILLWRYRYRQGGAEYRPDWGFNRWLEIIMWGVPFAIIFVLGAMLITSTHKLDPDRPLGPQPMQIQVVGLNWKWLFIYPEQGIATIDTLVIPVDRPVTLVMTTDTVMQSMMVPALFGQINAMPGMVTKMNFVADRTGTTMGRNWLYSGNGFANQQFPVTVVSSGDFSNWAKHGSAATVALDGATYSVIAKPGAASEAKSAIGMGSDVTAPIRVTDPTLFNRVVMRYHQGKALPNSAQPGTQSYDAGASQ